MVWRGPSAPHLATLTHANPPTMPKEQTTMPKNPSLKTLLKTASLPERGVSIVMNRQLVADFQVAEDRLHEAQQKRNADARLASDVKTAAQAVEDLREQMKSSTITFTLRGFRRDEWRALKAKYPMGENPSNSDRLLNADANALFDTAVRASIIAPTDIEDEDWDALIDVLTDGEWQRFVDAVYALNEEGTGVPFSKASYVEARRNADG